MSGSHAFKVSPFESTIKRLSAHEYVDAKAVSSGFIGEEHRESSVESVSSAHPEYPNFGLIKTDIADPRSIVVVDRLSSIETEQARD